MRLDRSRSGGGISLYVRETLKFLIRNDIPGEGIELLCIEIQPLKCKPFLFLAWYRPPNDPVCTFHKFERVLSYLDKENKEIILMGDINCDLSQECGRSPSDSNSRHLLNLYQLFSLKQIIKEPTRVTLTTLTVIDHIATTCTDNILDSGHRNSRTRMRTLSRDLTHQWGIIMADNDWRKATGSATRN